MMNENVQYVFSSVYRFSPEGARNVEESFESTPEGRDALCRYDASMNQFTFQCSRDSGDEAFSTFIATVKNYIEVEEKREEDIAEVVMRVERIPETILNEPEYFEDDAISTVEATSHGLARQPSEEAFPDSIPIGPYGKVEVNDGEYGVPRSDQDSELIGNLHTKTVTQMWKPSGWSESTKSLLCSDMAGKVAKLTRCGIQLGPEQRSVILTGEVYEAVQRAVSKLVVLTEASYCKDTIILFFDFQISEKDLDTRLQFIPLQKDIRRLRTTLINLGSPHISVLHDLLVLVLLKRDVNSKYMMIPDQKRKRLQSLNTHCRIWPPAFEYKQRGHERLMLTSSTLASTSSSGARSTIHEHLPRSVAALVEKWREEVTVPSVHGSHNAATNTQLEFERGRGPSVTENVSTFRKPATPQKRTYGLKRVPKGMPPEVAKESGFRATAPAVSDNIPQHTSLAAVEGNPMFHNRDSSPNAHLPGMRDLTRSPEGANNMTTSTSTRSVASTTLARGYMTPTSPPVPGSSAQLPPRSLGGSDQENSPARSGNPNALWRTHVMHSERTGDLLDFSAARQKMSNAQSRMPPQARNAVRKSGIRRPVSQRTEDIRSGKAANESLQIADEIKSRTAKNTMNQQKVPSGEDAAHGDAAVMKSFEAAAVNMLMLARSCTGTVTLEVDVGRILIRPQDVAQDYRRGIFTAREWSYVFPSGQEAGFRETMFSDMITTSWVDAEFILDLKFSSGRRMFDETPHRVRVVYEIVCSSRLTREGSQVIVEVEDDGKYQVRSLPKVLGAINYHFPKRMWDARLALTTTTLITDDSFGFPAGGTIDEITTDGRLLKAAKAIVDNLYVPPGQKVLDFYTKTVNKDKTPNKDLKIEAVLLRRESCHRSTANVHLNLRLTEIQDLVIQCPTDRKYSVHAFSQPPEVMVEDNRLWWTASLSSDEAEATFKENVHLELGELAAWTPEILVNGGVIRNLSDLAQEVVTRIDNVGYGNKGPHIEPTKQTTVTGTVTASTAGAGTQTGFW